MKKDNNQAGFTLVEVMIAIFVLTIGILGAAAMQVSSIEGNNVADRLSEAATWGADELETLMGQDFKKLTDASDAGVNAGVTGLNNTDVVGREADSILTPFTALKPIPRNNFTVFWNVADDFPVLGTKTIRVLVRRSDKGIQKTITQDFIKMGPI